MSKANIKGKKFFRLTVLERAGSNKHKHALWKCRCDCGNIKITSGALLRRGETKSCGCYNRETVPIKKVDLTGKRFGRLLVTKEAGRDPHKKVLWKCLCDCGKTTYITSSNVRRSISCGYCSVSEIKKQNKRGRPVGYKHLSETRDRISNTLKELYRSRHKLSDEMLQQYKNNKPAADWLMKHRDEIDSIDDVITERRLNTDSNPKRFLKEFRPEKGRSLFFKSEVTPELLLMFKEEFLKAGAG